jgi:hypothetical protein
VRATAAEGAAAAGATTVRGAATPSRAGRREAWAPAAGGASLCGNDLVGDDVPACVRQLGAQPAWSELRRRGDGAAEVLGEVLASLARLEGQLARLGALASGEAAYAVRLSEGLVRSVRDVLREGAGEAEAARRGGWRALLLRPGGPRRDD